MNLHSNSISYSKILKRTKTSFNGWIPEQTLMYTCNRLLLRVNRNELLIHVTIGMDLKGFMCSKNSISKVYMLYDCIYITISKWQNYRHKEEEVVEKWMTMQRGSIRDFFPSGAVLHLFCGGSYMNLYVEQNFTKLHILTQM